MLYFLLKVIFKIALKVFFKRVVVKKKQALPPKGPLLVVSNHPNTFMDPIVIASLLKQEVYFIAKSTVFKTPLTNWLLHKMNLIPVYRKEDGAVNASGNDATFQKCFEFLRAQGTLLIFPEGNSFNERRLRPLKTGSARIALGAAAQNNFTQEIYLLPIGLNYSDPTRFRSEVLVNIAAPIAVSEFAELYRQDASQAYRALTDQIRRVLEEQVIHTASTEDDELVRQIEIVYKSRLLAEMGGESSLTEEFTVTRRIVESLQYFKKSQPERVIRIQQQIHTYLHRLKRLQLKDEFFFDQHGKRHLGRWLFGMGIYLLLGFPVYLYGLLTNYLPYIIPAKVAHALTEEEEFIAPILMTTGIFTFPFFYGLQVYGVYYFTHSVFITILFAVSLPIAGFWARWYYQKLTETLAHLKLLALFFNKSNLVGQLIEQRRSILQELEQAKQQYLRDTESKIVPTDKT